MSKTDYTFRCTSDDFIEMARRRSDNKLILRITALDVGRDIPVACEFELTEKNVDQLRFLGLRGKVV